HHSGHARAHHQGRLGWQDILAHRMEDRLCLRGAAAAARRRQGAPVPDLYHRAQSAGGGGLRARQIRRLFPEHAQGAGEEPRPADRGTGKHRLSCAAFAGHLFPHRRPVAARIERNRRGVLQAHRPRLQGRRDPGVGVLRAGRRDLGGAVLFRQEGCHARHRAGTAVGRSASPKEGGLTMWGRGRSGFMAALAATLTLFSVPARPEERVVNFYNWSNYIAPDVLENFTRETGIKVVYDTFDANETLETRLLAGKSGYDVVVPTAY